jgi:hypothetical protein
MVMRFGTCADEMGGELCTCGNDKNEYKILVGKPEEKTSLGSPRPTLGR